MGGRDPQEAPCDLTPAEAGKQRGRCDVGYLLSGTVPVVCGRTGQPGLEPCGSTTL